MKGSMHTVFICLDSGWDAQPFIDIALQIKLLL